MKKTIFLSLLCFMSSYVLFAQKLRHCDLKVEMIAPAHDAIIHADTAKYHTFLFTNLGPDTLVARDTVYYEYTYDNNSIAPYPGIYLSFSGLYLKPNDTATFSQADVYSANNVKFTHIAKYCINTYIHDVYNVGGPNTVIDTNLSNNNPCDSFYCIKLGIAQTPTTYSQYSLAPNPARDQAIISYTLAAPAEVSCVVYDMAGRMVYSRAPRKEESGERLLPVNTASLPAGIYLVKTRFGDEVKTSRLAVVR